ncbi:MAG: hypothetical protein JFAIHJKO_02242 [Pyrinomonadaceae bacterium]|nr:hypothetical protein [Pyrinomonadaceae bacterium]
MGFNLAILCLFVLCFVAGIGCALRIDLRRERYPFTVRRPYRPARSGRDLRNLLTIVAIRFHRPDLPAGYISDLLSIRRPHRPRARRRTARDLLLIRAVDLHHKYLRIRSIRCLINNADSVGDPSAVGRNRGAANAFDIDQIVNGKFRLRINRERGNGKHYAK